MVLWQTKVYKILYTYNIRIESADPNETNILG
jgi:hypothetical protein